MLWVAIKALEALCTPKQRLRVVIYTGDVEVPPAAILAKGRVECLAATAPIRNALVCGHLHVCVGRGGAGGTLLVLSPRHPCTRVVHTNVRKPTHALSLDAVFRRSPAPAPSRPPPYSVAPPMQATFHVDPSPMHMSVDFVYIRNRRLLEAAVLAAHTLQCPC